LLRLQKHLSETRLQGLDILVGGNIPVASGLSSSTALTVATALAISHVNGIDLELEHLVNLCAEAEWFVGTRGGHGDHAAMIFASPQTVNVFEFNPLRRIGEVPFPGDYTVLICHSGIAAHKSAEAQQTFNLRVACYHIALEWLNRAHQTRQWSCQSLRDLRPDALKVSLADFYRLIHSVPQNLSGEQVKQEFGKVYQRFVSVQADSRRLAFPVRDVLMYGIAEMERSYRFVAALRDEDEVAIRRLMQISHDGDRISRRVNGETTPFRLHYDDQTMQDLIERAGKGDPSAAPYLQPGRYACSTPELDTLVDIAMDTEGVIGAQMCGAGLGGSVMVLVHREQVQACAKRINELYYKPRNMEPRMFLATGGQRACVLQFPDENTKQPDP